MCVDYHILLYQHIYVEQFTLSTKGEKKKTYG